MLRNFTPEYWIDNGWYVGSLKEVPGVFSQDETLEKLEENIKDAYHSMMAEEEQPPSSEIRTKELKLEV